MLHWLVMGKIIRLALGFLFLILGVIGLMLPVIPQWPFLIPAFMLLSYDIPWFMKMRIKIRTKYPNSVGKWEGVVSRYTDKWFGPQGR